MSMPLLNLLYKSKMLEQRQNIETFIMANDEKLDMANAEFN